MFVTTPSVITDTDRALALVRHLYGNRNKGRGSTPLWMSLTVLAEFLQDVGATPEVVVAAYLHRMFIESAITVNEAQAFCTKLKCNGTVVVKIAQLFTLMESSVDVVGVLVNFTRSGQFPLETIHVYFASKFMQYGYYQRHNVATPEILLETIERNVGAILGSSSDEMSLVLGGYLLELVDQLRDREDVFTKEEITV